LGITRELDGRKMADSCVIVRRTRPRESIRIVASPRIGITKAADWPLRFHLAGSPWISRKETGGSLLDSRP